MTWGTNKKNLKEGWYLVTMEDRGERYVRPMNFSREGFFRSGSEGGLYDVDKIIAFQRFPKAYKGG